MHALNLSWDENALQGNFKFIPTAVINVELNIILNIILI